MPLQTFVFLIERIKEEKKYLANLYDNLQKDLIVLKDSKIVNDTYWFEAAKNNAGKHLHDYYICLEKLFEEIFVRLKEDLPDGKTYHKDLLIQAITPLPGLRPSIIDKELFQHLDELRGFRHVFRNLYRYQLNTEKLLSIVGRTISQHKKIEKCLDNFINFLEEQVRMEVK